METFRRWTGNLDLITNMNNDVLKQLNPVELPLVKPYLEKFDKVRQTTHRASCMPSSSCCTGHCPPLASMNGGRPAGSRDGGMEGGCHPSTRSPHLTLTD